MTARKSKASAKPAADDFDAVLAELQKTKGGVTVEETDDEKIIRTRDGDVHRFKKAG